VDPALADALRILGAAAAGALAGGIIGEWRARAAERRADERDRKRLRAEHTLRQISETERDYMAASDWLLRWVAGDAEGIKTVQHGSQPYPDANMYLLGDEVLIRQVIDLRAELHEGRAFGSGLTAEDVGRLGAQRGHVSARLAAQRERVLSGEEPIWPSEGFVRSLLDEAQAKYGVPPEYRPRMKGDE
jgi:hypothetical protein